LIGQEIVKKLEESAQATDTKDQAVNTPPAGYNRASELGWVYDCPRYLCLRRMYPEKETAPGTSLKRRFREGKKQERLIVEDLTAAGFKLEKLGRLVWDKYKISGEIDRLIEINGQMIPIEFKSCSSAMFHKVERAQTKEDLIRSPHIWLRHYPVQCQTYMLLTRREPSVLLFKDKEAGDYYPMDMDLDAAYASVILDGVQYVNDCVEKENPPPAELKEACEGCGFFAYDFPGTEKAQISQAGIEIIDDPDWLMKLQEYQALLNSLTVYQEKGAERLDKKFDKLDKEIKEAFQGRKVIIGEHLIESKPYQTPTYDIPKEIKEKYKQIQERFRTSIKLIGGEL